MIADLGSTEPSDLISLLQRAQAIAGYTLGELAKSMSFVMPKNLKRDKGWVGMLLERYFGLRANNRSEQDFPDLQVELKTIPIDRQGNPLETTFVCCVSLVNHDSTIWEASYLRYKLQQVLWIPVEGSRDIPLSQRCIGSAFLWKPSREEERQLKQDWEELMDMIVLGKIASMNAHHGEVLQIRPKASNSRVLTQGVGESGALIMTQPRGFYLRKSFTRALISRQFFPFLQKS